MPDKKEKLDPEMVNTQLELRKTMRETGMTRAQAEADMAEVTETTVKPPKAKNGGPKPKKGKK